MLKTPKHCTLDRSATSILPRSIRWPHLRDNGSIIRVQFTLGAHRPAGSRNLYPQGPESPVSNHTAHRRLRSPLRPFASRLTGSHHRRRRVRPEPTSEDRYKQGTVCRSIADTVSCILVSRVQSDDGVEPKVFVECVFAIISGPNTCRPCPECKRQGLIVRVSLSQAS